MINTELLKEFISVRKKKVVCIFIKAFGDPTHHIYNDPTYQSHQDDGCQYDDYQDDGYWLWYVPERPLLVAHIDTVCLPRLPVDLGEGVWRTHGTADDRAGVYTICELKKSYQDLSILLTDGEESGGKGVARFCSRAKKEGLKFLYAIEYDRRGTDDCIDYNEVNHPDFMKVFKKYYKPAKGTYSDVSTIQRELKLSAVNLSTGYEHNHSREETLRLDVIERNLRLFPTILEALGERYYPTIP